MGRRVRCIGRPLPRPAARMLAGALAGLLALPWSSGVRAQEGGESAPTFEPAQLEQLVAPIALYPDPLLAQVLMASTYPLEVVEAARWQKDNPKLEGEALDQALQGQAWDASVKSLVSFPQVLTMMNDKLDWTQKLGDAFLAQQSDVMDAVQRLRAKAEAEGNLETTKEQKVVVEQAPPPPAGEAPPTAAPTTVIKIEPADPQVVYVPTYNPTVVYGTWPYPAYPPYYYYPPGYVAGASILSFGVGMAVGAALWGDCNWGWGHSHVDVNIKHYNEFNTNVTRNFNRNTTRNEFQNGRWQHDSSHRKGVQYRDRATQTRYGRAPRAGADSREAFRGRAEQGRQQIAREGAGNIQKQIGKGGGSQLAARQPRAGNAAARPQAGAGGAAQRAPAAARQQAASRPGAASQAGRKAASSPAPKAFSGMGSSGSQVRRDSNRGRASRMSAGGGGGSRGGRAGGGGGRRR